MSKMAKKVIIAIPIVIVAIGFVVYFLFPGPVYKLLRNRVREAAGLEQKHIQVDAWRITYLDGGRGQALILLHGFGANKDNWTPVARYLSPHFRLIAPDLPGFGESSRPMDAKYSIGAQVERLDQFVTALRIERFHLGGHSMGGAIAGAYAAKYGYKVNSLWLIAPGGVISAQPSELAENLVAGHQNILIVETPEDYDRLMTFVFVHKPYIPGVIKKYFISEAIHQRPLNEIIFNQIIAAWSSEPLERLLKDLPIPALILWGDHDRVLHVSGASVLASLLPKSETVIMEQVGHAPILEKPKASAQFLLDFLGKGTP